MNPSEAMDNKTAISRHALKHPGVLLGETSQNATSTPLSCNASMRACSACAGRLFLCCLLVGVVVLDRGGGRRCSDSRRRRRASSRASGSGGRSGLRPVLGRDGRGSNKVHLPAPSRRAEVRRSASARRAGCFGFVSPAAAAAAKRYLFVYDCLALSVVCLSRPT